MELRHRHPRWPRAFHKAVAVLNGRHLIKCVVYDTNSASRSCVHESMKSPGQRGPGRVNRL
jgi:hypothetical protein